MGGSGADALPRNESVKQTHTLPGLKMASTPFTLRRAVFSQSLAGLSKMRKMFYVIPCLPRWRSTPDIAVTMPLSSICNISVITGS